MTIEKIIENETETIKISGRLDTATAPELEQAINALSDDVKKLILDMQELEYTSSAGLRVILKAQKMMIKRGNMKLINVNNDIMEVFDITGFLDILTIE
jgi:anti-sigma B factor antagonist